LNIQLNWPRVSPRVPLLKFDFEIKLRIKILSKWQKLSVLRSEHCDYGTFWLLVGEVCCLFLRGSPRRATCGRSALKVLRNKLVFVCWSTSSGKSDKKNFCI